MDIRIGIANSPREIAFETDESATSIQQTIAQALDSDARHFTLKDDKGKLFIVPTASFAYIEIGSDTARRVGFVA